ncbi:inorganic phosphate cotransporter [Olea europaea subsp. europaea]|uniref:Inorganic phosphate cotransporter n=1 Tax=Olea europaea subsp. europaea TaxID=158383 RepID=A0A8S0QAA9_OLEEU|nr:inorganic phosphate cotransporter [Olea europaea subsp. europaea]
MSQLTGSEVNKSSEELADVIFKRMVTNDKKQNQVLKNKLSKGSGSRGEKVSGQDEAEKSTGMRFVVVTLGVLSLAMSMMCRGTINYCITSMIDPRMNNANKTLVTGNEVLENLNNNSDPILFYMTTEYPTQNSDELPTTTTIATTDATIDSTTSASTTESIDESTTTIETTTQTAIETTTQSIIETTTNLILDSTTTQISTVDENASQNDKFMWSTKDQSLIKGGFYYSYFFFMVLGGRMSEIYGAKYVLLLGVAGSAIINLATPWMARNSFTMLIISRTIMGAIQSGVFPAMYALINKWLTMSEASIYAPMIKMSLRTGGLLASLLPGLISNWPDVFYVVGGLGAVWSVLWLFISTSEPSTNRWVTKTELKHILKKKRQVVKQQDEEEEGIKMAEVEDKNETSVKVDQAKKAQPLPVKTPWIKIITSPSVIGLIMAKLSFNHANDFMQIELPSYLKYVHAISDGKRSFITTSMFAIQVSLVVFAGWLAKVMIKKKPFGMSKTGIRKLFQSLASVGSGILMLMLTIDDVGLTYITVILQISSVASVFVAGGETMLPYDLSEEYPATIMAIANSLANLSGITVTALTGFVLGNEAGSQSRWNTVIGIIACFDILGGLLFCFLIKAEPIDFSSKKSKSKSSKQMDENIEEGSVDKAPSYELAMIQAAKSELPEKDDNNNDNNPESIESKVVSSEAAEKL